MDRRGLQESARMMASAEVACVNIWIRISGGSLRRRAVILVGGVRSCSVRVSERF